MDPQNIGGKTLVEHAIDTVLLCGEFCNTLALIAAFVVFYLLSLLFQKD